SQFDGGGIQFYQPFALNVIDPSRMLIVTANRRTGIGHIYESLNRGDSLTDLGSLRVTIVGNGGGYGRPIAYGGPRTGLPVPDVFYAAAGNRIFQRVTVGGPITALNSYPGGAVTTISINPNNYKELYVSDTNNKVWRSLDGGTTTWTDITANLPTLTKLITTVELFSPLSGTPTLYAGGFGVF